MVAQKEISRRSLNAGIGTATYYQRHYASRSWQWYQHLLSHVVRFSQPGPILDVGCGAGLFVEAAQQWGFDCSGIDGSIEAVRIASLRLPNNRIAQHFLSDPFPFEDHRFQTVIMHQVIEHLEPDAGFSAASECLRVLRPGGMLYVSSPSKANHAQRMADSTHICMYSPTELHRLLASIGFVDIAPMNSARDAFGKNKIARLLARGLFRIFHWDLLSASADCRAYSPIAKYHG
jgi:2-polyprenyl-3-methyl-5-hydroxy-6-metoxy-1,4-benzoquinol methylase